MPFHPAVSGWLTEHFGRPTDVQTRAWAVTAQHRHALIAAPTGSGKTLAAFLSAINDLVVEGLARGLGVWAAEGKSLTTGQPPAR